MVPWHLGLFLCTDHQQAAIEMIFRVSHHRCLRCSWGILTFNSQKTCYFNCLLMFLSFPTYGYISIILDCWCFVYKFLCNKFTLHVQIIIYWRNLKDAFFFSFCEICKEFVLQCTEMNKHWKLVYCCLILYFQRQESHNLTFGGKGR